MSDIFQLITASLTAWPIAPRELKIQKEYFRKLLNDAEVIMYWYMKTKGMNLAIMKIMKTKIFGILDLEITLSKMNRAAGYDEN